MSELVMMPQKDYKDICDAVRAKTGGTDLLKSGDIPAQIESISTGGGSSVPWNDVTFIDYDGTVLHSYTLEEAQALTELPPLPEQKGLICQGWNWSLEDIKAQGKVIVGAMYITDDGKTRIYITLHEGRTSPMLGVCVNGTVTVDWGDGTEPDVLTGTSTSTVVWTPNHNYAKAGDYVISLSVDGEMSFKHGSSDYLVCYSSGSDGRNTVYRNSVKKIEIGENVKIIGNYAFDSCYTLGYISIPKGVTDLGQSAFKTCYSLNSIVIPNGVTNIINNMFNSCYTLGYISIPKGVTVFSNSTFASCWSLENIIIPKGVTTLQSNAFQACYTLASISIPDGVTSFGSNCFTGNGVRYYDFTACTSVPPLSSTSTFSSFPDDCQFLIPSALYDEWSTATNWATYASYMVAV